MRTPNRRTHELNTQDISVGQRPDIAISTTEAFNRDDIDSAIPYLDNGGRHDDYAEALRFAEEPMTIRLERSSEKNAASSEQVAVNGKGIELLIGGAWVSTGWIPVGQVVITKRKYVEVIARSKPESVSTDVMEKEGEDPVNRIRRYSSQKNPFSVIKDDNPRGAQWLTSILQEAA